MYKVSGDEVSSAFCTNTMTNPLIIYVKHLYFYYRKISTAIPYYAILILLTIWLKFCDPFFWKIKVNNWNLSRYDYFLDRNFLLLFDYSLLNNAIIESISSIISDRKYVNYLTVMYYNKYTIIIIMSLVKNNKIHTYIINNIHKFYYPNMLWYVSVS